MDGQVKIGDFGLVTALEENCEYTPVCDGPTRYFKHTDQVGTKLYMSPEQVRYEQTCNKPQMLLNTRGAFNNLVISNTKCSQNNNVCLFAG